MEFVWWLTSLLKYFDVKHPSKAYMCMHLWGAHNKFRKIVSELSRVKASKDFLKTIVIMKNAFLWVLELDKVQDNKAYIKGYKEHPTSEWSRTRACIRKMKNMTMKMEL